MPQPIKTEKIKEALLRMPAYLHEEAHQVATSLKRTDREWSFNRVCVEAIRRYLMEVKREAEAGRITPT